MMPSPLPSHACSASPALARGQALVEFLVTALFFLVPLFLAMIVLGKLADVRHTGAMAARYAAWERTVWYDGNGSVFDSSNGPNQKSATQIGNEIAVRLINDRSSARTVIRHADRNATSFANGIDPMWHDNEHSAYLDTYDQLGRALSSQTPGKKIAAGALEAIGALPLPQGVTGTLVPPVPHDTLAVAEVSLKRIAANSQAYQRLWPQGDAWNGNWTGFDFVESGAILSNTWAANGSGATAAMVGQSVPTSRGLGTAIGTAVNLAKTGWDPLAPWVEFGKVAPDVVPEDRLK